MDANICTAFQAIHIDAPPGNHNSWNIPPKCITYIGSAGLLGMSVKVSHQDPTSSSIGCSSTPFQINGRVRRGFFRIFGRSKSARVRLWSQHNLQVPWVVWISIYPSSSLLETDLSQGSSLTMLFGADFWWCYLEREGDPRFPRQ